MAAATANALTMLGGAWTADLLPLLVGMVGTACSAWGWIFFTEEAETMEEKKPTYHDVATRLRWEIHNEAAYHPGCQLPTTREIAERFEVTRRTVGRALKELATEGLIITIPGRGSFVVGADNADKPRERVEKYILSNTRKDAFLPSTEELAAICGVSNATVLRAVAQMTRQGLLRRNGRTHQRRQ